MHRIVPAGRSGREADAIFGSALYRKKTLDHARDLFELAGVPEDQARQFMDTILAEFPCPTAEQLFLEKIDTPLMALALGERRQELSYYRTGVPELTEEDLLLFKKCLKEYQARIVSSPSERETFLKAVLRTRDPRSG